MNIQIDVYVKHDCRSIFLQYVTERLLNIFSRLKEIKKIKKKQSNIYIYVMREFLIDNKNRK